MRSQWSIPFGWGTFSHSWSQQGRLRYGGCISCFLLWRCLCSTSSSLAGLQDYAQVWEGLIMVLLSRSVCVIQGRREKSRGPYNVIILLVYNTPKRREVCFLLRPGQTRMGVDVSWQTRVCMNMHDCSVKQERELHHASRWELTGN